MPVSKKTYSFTGLGWIWEDEVGKVNRVMCCSDHLDSQGPPYLIHLLPSMRQYDEPGDDNDDHEDNMTMMIVTLMMMMVVMRKNGENVLLFSSRLLLSAISNANETT